MQLLNLIAFSMVMVYVVAVSLFLTGLILTDKPRKERKGAPVWIPVAPIYDSRSSIVKYRPLLPTGRWI